MTDLIIALPPDCEVAAAIGLPQPTHRLSPAATPAKIEASRSEEHPTVTAQRIDTSEIVYPESDGKPVADNTQQFHWLTVIQYNLDWLFARDPNVFVAGDLLWYPVEGNNQRSQAPDVMVVFGVPKGDRSSYLQWRENDIAPQVVFEIRSPSNRQTEFDRKQHFYDRYGVEEYYLYDPRPNDLSGWQRQGDRLEPIAEIATWTSPRLGIHFELTATTLNLYQPDRQPFATFREIQTRLAETEQALAAERQRAEAERDRAERLAARLRALGIDPDSEA